MWTSPVRSSDGRLLPTHGPRVVRWIEKHCVYGEGDWYGQPVRLRPFQKSFIWRLYEYYPETGERRYRRALWMMGKGNGKTPIGSFIGAYELLGGQHTFPRVMVAASSLKQANLVFGDLRATVEQSPTLADYVEAFDLQILIRPQYGDGLAERIAAEAGTNDGPRATAFLADELHEWTGARSRVHMVVEGAIAKRKNAISVTFSTAGWDRLSLLYGLYDYGKKVAKGELVDDQFLFECYEAPEDLDLNDEAQLLEAIAAANPALGDFNDLNNILYRRRTMPELEFRRYHLNQWTSSATRYIPMEDWDHEDCGQPAVIEPGLPTVVAIDGAAKRDTTGVVVVQARGDERHVSKRVFEPPAPGEIIDPSIVEQHVRDVCQQLQPEVVVYDPHLFFRSAELLRDEGYPMEEFPQSNSRLVPASQALYDVVVEHRIRHGGDEVLRAHVDGAVAKPVGGGYRLDKGKATRPIDLAIATAMGVYRLEELVAGGTPGIRVLGGEVDEETPEGERAVRMAASLAAGTPIAWATLEEDLARTLGRVLAEWAEQYAEWGDHPRAVLFLRERERFIELFGEEDGDG